jgi:5-methylcytosine-specific restriction endonuclease McrA
MVFRRDRGLCQFKTAEGKICGSRYQIEIDHIVPVSAGGTNSFENLRCLCRAHNQWKSDKILT